MKAETIPVALHRPGPQGPGATQVRWSDLVELAKPRITLMVLVTVAAGAYLAVPATFSPLLIAETLVATAILASAASALNQAMEASEDARMARTAARPLAAGRLDRGWVLAGATGASLLAILLLAWRANALTATVGAITLVSYLLCYTPLKKRTSWATLVGAVPGALPPVLGWSAVTGEIGAGAWILFGLVFLWQLPHFMAIAWIYRDDYRRGGFWVLPMRDPTGGRTAGAMVVPTLALVALTTVAPGLGLGSPVTAAGGLVAGAGFLAACLLFWSRREAGAARTVLLASVLYLPVVLAVMLVDRLMRVAG